MSHPSSQRREKIVPNPKAIEEDEQMYGHGHGSLSKDELDQKFPNRPHNHSLTLPFHTLHEYLFKPLDENKKKPSGQSGAKKGPSKKLPPHEVRRNVIERFIARWRKEVGDDFYPAMRLIIPEKDRDRAMYGLKEKNIGKILIKIMRIDKNSEDGYNLLNWKQPGQKTASKNAGDFAGRCFEVISKRPLRTAVGDMRIGEVNVLLDELSAASKEDDQVPIFETFYERMNPDELMWLIRIILRQMKVGATEKTFLNLWHPDGESLFNISSSLSRCCWELVDQSVRLGSADEGVSVTLMECFQPQLAQFQMHNFGKMVEKLTTGEKNEDKTFWIEEKLDGERMQLHMKEDDSIPGGKKFGFWSRKAKDYTYLYGNGFFDDNSALTRHLKDAFDGRVKNIILDGEMITWDPETDTMVGFGTLKSAAIAEQKNPFSSGQRPLFRVFDILFVNDKSMTNYTLRDRRKMLDASVHDVHRRIEKHKYTEAHDQSAIEPALRKVVSEASEGLVLKNPRSIYRLNSRNDDWMKVKPEYMTEFGENLDCVVIGGYYGSGHRGGNISSFLCGLKMDKDKIEATKSNPEKCLSFFKVGGGFRAEDYANIRHHTDGKWMDWDPKNPPTEWIELGGGPVRQFERPDVWIKPHDSVVIESKAASVAFTEQFAAGLTLRFPRFRKLRMDKTWETALSFSEFIEVKKNAEVQETEKKFEVEGKRRGTKRLKQEMAIAGNGQGEVEYAGPSSKLFDGLDFVIMSERTLPPAKSKQELEQLVKAHGGKIYQNAQAVENIICVADKRLVKVVAVMKAGYKNVLNSSWILDCIRQAEIDEGKPRLLLPFEPQHLYHALEDTTRTIEGNVDEYGDSYCRDVTTESLRELVKHMSVPNEKSQSAKIRENLDDELKQTPAYMFRGFKVYVSGLPAESLIWKSDGQIRMKLASNILRFGGGEITNNAYDDNVTHMVVDSEKESEDAKIFRKMTSDRARLPRIVTVKWIEDTWAEKTLLDEESYAPR